MYPGTVREQEPASQPAAEQVAGRVAAECAEPGQREQGENIDVALAGDHAAQQSRPSPRARPDPRTRPSQGTPSPRPARTYTGLGSTRSCRPSSPAAAVERSLRRTGRARRTMPRRQPLRASPRGRQRHIVKPPTATAHAIGTSFIGPGSSIVSSSTQRDAVFIAPSTWPGRSWDDDRQRSHGRTSAG